MAAPDRHDLPHLRAAANMARVVNTEGLPCGIRKAKSAPLTLTERMRRIRKTDTKPEMIVRRTLHAIGFRYRLHHKQLPGDPDIMLPRHGKVIFVHGCFWHRHDCPNGRKLPRSKPEY